MIIKIFTLLFFCFSFSLAQIENKQENIEEYDRYFDGLYFGLSAGSQNIFGGAFIDNLDFLTQKSGFVVEPFLGYRWQLLEDRLVLGIEGQIGFTDGNLKGFDNRHDLDVFYENYFQRSIGLIAGAILGGAKNYLLLIYLYSTKRNFDIKIVDKDGISYTQKDGQGFLRYGLSLEKHLTNRFNIRASFGGIYTDFGDLILSQEVDDKFDFNIGLVIQL